MNLKTVSGECIKNINKKLNRNKKYFLNILKTTEFKLNDKLRPLIEEINLKKSKLI